MYLKVVRRRSERVPKAREGESTRGGIPLSSGGEGFGRFPSRIFFDLWLHLCAFLICILDVFWAEFQPS